MSTNAEALRTAIAVLTAQLALVEGKPSGTYLGQILPGFNADEAEKKRLAEIAESMKPRTWREWVAGVPPDQVGDNDPPDDDFLRAFEPMMRAAGQQGVKDSTGAVFFFPNIKARTGHGWLGVKRECLALVTSQWGQDWMANPDNARIVPKPAAIALLVKQVSAAA